MSGIFNSVKNFVTGGDYEKPSYTVVKKTENYEERLYKPCKWVKTSGMGMTYKSTSSACFWKLFGYISGKNSANTKVPMTAPVTTLVEPGDGPNCESKFSMSFYIPEAFQNSPPTPNEADVSIEERPELAIFTSSFMGEVTEEILVEEAVKLGMELQQSCPDRQINYKRYFLAIYNFNHSSANPTDMQNEIWTYGGFANDKNIEEERVKLLGYLSEVDRATIRSDGQAYYVVGYDSPFKLFGRRNEIWLIKKL